MKKTTFLTIITVMALSLNALGANLVYNGDFELGDTGFYSDYSNITSMFDPGTYRVGPNPNDYHPAWTSYYDHTFGTAEGNMLIVNAIDDPDDPDDIIWEQTIAVVPYANYELSYWLASSYHTYLAEIECSINGVPLDPNAMAPAFTGKWMKVVYEFNVDSAASITITLRDLTEAYDGDDFAIDDIALLEQYCETTFAYDEGGDCFSDLGSIFRNNWGWTIGTIDPNDNITYTFDLYAGAGQCDIGKGMYVGDVDVTYYEDGTLDVVPYLEPGFSLAEEHIYAGSTPVPVTAKNKPTVSPGQYYIDIDSADPDPIYFIYHAVVCWYE